MSPHIMPNHMSYARALVEMEEFDEAEKVYMNVLVMEKDRWTGSTFFALGKLYHQTERMDLAAVCFSYALERNPQDRETMNYLDQTGAKGGHYTHDNEQAFLRRLAGILNVTKTK